MKPHSGIDKEPVKPSQWDEKDLKPAAPPTYQDIEVTFIPGPGSIQSTYPSLNFNNDGLPVVQGVPVTADEQAARAQMNGNNRRIYWTYRRSSQNFICLNVCYTIILLVMINASFSDFSANEDICPNFAKASLFLGILSIIWICCNLIAIYAAVKRSEKLIRVYLMTLYVLFGLVVAIAAFGLLSKDDDCTKDSSETVALVASALFAVFILGLFGYTASRLRRMLIGVPARV